MRRDQARLFDIGPRSELQDGIRPIDMAIDRILVGEHALCQTLADDNDGLFIIVIVIKRIEIAAGNDRNAKRRKKTGRDGARLRPGILYTCRMDVSVAGKLQSAEAAIAPGNNVAERGLTYARQGVNAAYRFLVEIDDLLRCLPIGHSRNIDSEDVLSIQSCLGPL